MRAWAFVLALALIQVQAEESGNKKTNKVGSLVETIGIGDLRVGESGKARFTFWEKTYPNDDKSTISCGLKTTNPGNYTLEIVRPDKSNETILVVVERDADEDDSEGPLRAYFPVDIKDLRPSVINIRLMQGPDNESGELLGSVDIIEAREVCRTRRDTKNSKIALKSNGAKAVKRNGNGNAKNKQKNKNKPKNKHNNKNKEKNPKPATNTQEDPEPPKQDNEEPQPAATRNKLRNKKRNNKSKPETRKLKMQPTARKPRSLKAPEKKKLAAKSGLENFGASLRALKENMQAKSLIKTKSAGAKPFATAKKPILLSAGKFGLK